MNYRFVVDASVITKLYLRDEDHVTQTDRLFSDYEDRKADIVAPRITLYEVPAAILHAVKRARVTEETAKDAIRRFQQLRLPTVDDVGAMQETARTAIIYGCNYYDAIYILLAEDLGWRFITADQKLWRRIRDRTKHVVFLSSYR